MPNNLFSTLKKFINQVVNVMTTGNLERVKLINQFNRVFKDAYDQLALERWCIVSTASGNPKNKHELSHHYFVSGFKITINNDSNLTENDLFEISKYIIESKTFVRQLMSLGYDTLIIKGRNSYHIGLELPLKEIANLQDYFLN